MHHASDFEAANAILPSIPKDQHNTIARFLESQGFKEEALLVADDPDIKFDLALQLNKLDVCYDAACQAAPLLETCCAAFQVAFSIMTELLDTDSTDAQAKWKQLADLALATANLALAEECAVRAGDLPGPCCAATCCLCVDACLMFVPICSGLLLLHTSTGNGAGMAKLRDQASACGRWNIAFLCALLLGDVEHCLTILTTSGRLPEVRAYTLVLCLPAPLLVCAHAGHVL